MPILSLYGFSLLTLSLMGLGHERPCVSGLAD